MNHSHSKALFARAQERIPGGVNSPVRAFRGVGGDPVFFREATGAWMTDVDGNRYVDLVGSWGPLILGHAYPPIVEAIIEAARRGTTYGAPAPGEVELAELLCATVPSVEKVRLVSSGTEATVAAIRLARGFTGRDSILKFEGCFHGAGDPFLVKAGSGVETLGLPDSPGVPAALAKLTLTAPYNDLEAVERLFAEKGKDIACAIIEPVVGNMGVLVPKPGYLQGLQELCRKHGVLFVLDEVMTGFRLARGGAQELFGLKPDLSTFAKVVGGGMPLGAYGGRRDIMSKIAPEGPVYQSGTLSGNPVAVAAGLACLKALAAPGTYARLEQLGAMLEQGLKAEAQAAGVPVTLNRVGSMLTLFFCDTLVYDYTSAKKADTARFGRFFHAMLNEGVYLPPSQFEAAFVSLAIGEAEVAHILGAARKAFRSLA
ncbi:glutamate-1-semialdehyde 2,1-aminomutase [Stigmatella aurantiaca]|uniref:Glutamate-1-semialdehyde 2,1-aminomutase n=1 Tax=Stigmatella aurantiaca TaxID=41 RepID=A0A1H8AWZ3_STIAU|nr:glutamate-1-semialdehyde 2,1-aminomutase [Stigmatella aurantiaca]SEM74996.1 glutamate-1-semialdehyde 2,1-aminomutase [Stigmatella aurantiaca]